MSPRRARSLYGQRWEIETLFGALKSRGFNFEDTHLTDPKRIEKLVALLAIAFAWAYLVGDWLDRTCKPILIKSHRRRSKSVFRHGLDYLRMILLNIDARIDAFFNTLKVLSCTVYLFSTVHWPPGISAPLLIPGYRTARCEYNP